MVKLSLRLINEAPRHEDVWGNGGITSLFLTSALDGGEWSASHPLSLYPWRNSPRYQSDKRLGGPHSCSGLNGEEKNLASARNRTSAVHPVARLYAD
jgi:hypothetical protein